MRISLGGHFDRRLGGRSGEGEEGRLLLLLLGASLLNIHLSSIVPWLTCNLPAIGEGCGSLGSVAPRTFVRGAQSGETIVELADKSLPFGGGRYTADECVSPSTRIALALSSKRGGWSLDSVFSGSVLIAAGSCQGRVGRRRPTYGGTSA